MKNTLSLNGTWELAGFDEGGGNWALPGSLLPMGGVKLEGHVPGEVHVDLLRAGLIPDPYQGTNALDVQWVEGKEWWYKRTFDVDEDFLKSRTFLEFDGLDTFATVYLNGREVGRSSNMFVPARFDVSREIHEGRNTVAVRFEPTAAVASRMDHSRYAACFDTPRVNVRKMQCAFGWDWTHRFVGAGIWRDAGLVSCDAVSIANVHIEPEVVGGYADAWISIEVANHTGEDQQVMASVVVALGDSREKIEVADTVSPFGGIIEAVVRIEEPELWWPNGFGEQTLYTCMVGLQVEGEIQDASECKFGVRTVAIVERNERGGNAFTFMVNGEEVFCKGANWIPADHFVSNVTAERYRDLVTLARDANVNMLRVWGGGVYESPDFYAACDELGIMVWQDFMFACAQYPDNDDFVTQVANEAESAIKRLRNHPSVVLWCGNNECEMNDAPDTAWPGKRLFHEVIPNVLRRFDHTRPYRPSSPYGGMTGNDPKEGDWHGGSWFDLFHGDHAQWRDIIESKRANFVSEFYGHSSAMAESLREFIPGDSLLPIQNDTYELHNKDNPHSGRTDGLTHHQIMLALTRRMVGEMENVEQFAAYTGILHGEFIRAEIEHCRREKWDCSGALYWMFNDCWPALGTSAVDYYHRPKTAYYYMKRAFAPVIVSFKPVGDRVRLYVTSDERLRGFEGSAHIGLMDLETSKLSTVEIPIDLPPNTSRAFWESEPLSYLLDDPARHCLVALLDIKGEMMAKAVYFARPFAEMAFPNPKLLVHRTQSDEKRHHMMISANAYARNVAIANLPAGARPSDNFFDLMPGERYEVVIDNLTVEQANELKINVWRR